MLFDKVTATIEQIAKEKGIDLVVSEQALQHRRMSTQDLVQAMTQREILYKNASVDLTLEVIAKLDERYNAAKNKDDADEGQGMKSGVAFRLHRVIPDPSALIPTSQHALA